jgi:hypothetical protein
MVPYTYVAPIVTFTGAGQFGLALPLNKRGFINVLRVVQLTGGNAGFSYTLYNTIAACQPPTGLPMTGLGTTQRALYQVTPTIVVPNTFPSFTSSLGYPWDGEFNMNLAYVPQDDHLNNPLMGNPSDRSDYLYLNITAPGAGTFGVAVTYSTPLQ